MSTTSTPLTALAGFGLPNWLDLQRPHYPCLETNLTADAVVIGAGICGLKIAQYGLQTLSANLALLCEG